MKNINNSIVLLGLAVLGLGIVGCADPNDKLAETNPPNPKQEKDYSPTAAAGVYKDITKSQDPARFAALVTSAARFGSRPNPFAMSADEIAFDKQQAMEKIIIDGGSFGELYDLPESKVPGEEGRAPEPQPYRRLSGILIGDSVLAILEENGRSTIIRPGMMIPDTNWRVVSIDRDKAILRRDGNALPREVEVRLEIGFPSFGGGNTPSGPGGPGGRPGAPGMPGGPGTPGGASGAGGFGAPG